MANGAYVYGPKQKLTIMKKGRAERAANVSTGEKRRDGSTKTMPIVLYLGSDVNDYENHGHEIIDRLIGNGDIRCDICTDPICKHSSYERGIKETGQQLVIIIARCKKCDRGHALLPDFILPYKQYSGNEIESVIIDSASSPAKKIEIETEASESTVKRWIVDVGERIKCAIGKLKELFKKKGKPISEIALEPGPVYVELEQLLEMAPSSLKYNGNKLGLANIWLGSCDIRTFIR